MRKLNLDKLKEGLPGISPVYGAFLAEAAAFCLTQMGHQNNVPLSVRGDFEEDFTVEWKQKIDADQITSWGDIREATEFAAMGITILLMKELEGYQQFERKDQGVGTDISIWKSIFDESLPKPEESARVEVSGILKESKGNSVNMRIYAKRKQAGKYGGSNILSYISVIEFSIPKAKIVKK